MFALVCSLELVLGFSTACVSFGIAFDEGSTTGIIVSAGGSSAPTGRVGEGVVAASEGIDVGSGEETSAIFAGDIAAFEFAEST